MQTHNPRHGINTYHSHKQRVLGNPATHPAPAWRANAKAASSSGSELGSKILLSRLPVDVVENEVEVLFSRTVGPVKEVLMVYNSQGKSRGMAVVAFARPGDAAVARAKYNGKIVDGRRPIKIEIVTDEDTPRGATLAAAAPAQPSLLARIGKPTPAQAAAVANAPPQNGKKAQAQARNQAQATAAPVVAPKDRVRQKRGAGRLKKQRAQQGQQQQQQAQKKQKPKTKEDLDAEMEDYRANGPAIKISESMLQ